jgi:FHA domain
MVITTASASARKHWRITDEVHQLREWASTNIHPLPPPLAGGDKRTIGSSDACWLHLQDPKLLVSKQHAQLTYEPPEGWTITDLQSKNGLFVDGIPRVASSFMPGAEILIGGVTLVAESPRLCALRGILSRLIGWSSERRVDVDIALRAIRMAVALHEPLLLCAEAGHKSIARLLHRHVIGPDRPFVVCERRKPADKPARKSSARNAASAHATTTYERGGPALDAATGGTLVVQRNRLPEDFDQVLNVLRAPTARVLLVVCSQTPPHGLSKQLVVPPLAGRSLELSRIINEYAADAVAECGLGSSFTPDDRNWVAQQELTLAQIQTATRRLVMLRAEDGYVKRAAKRLGMAHGSLSDWLARRDLPELRGLRNEAGYDDHAGDDDDDRGDDE